VKKKETFASPLDSKTQDPDNVFIIRDLACSISYAREDSNSPPLLNSNTPVGEKNERFRVWWRQTHRRRETSLGTDSDRDPQVSVYHRGRVAILPTNDNLR